MKMPLFSRSQKKTTTRTPSSQGFSPGLHSPWPPDVLLSEGRGTPVAPPFTLDMLDVCKYAAASLDVPWPSSVTETTQPRYSGMAVPPRFSDIVHPLAQEESARVL